MTQGLRLSALLMAPLVFVAAAPAATQGSEAHAVRSSFITLSRDGAPAPYVLRDGAVRAFFGSDGVAISLARRGEPGRWGLRWGLASGAAVEPHPRGLRTNTVSTFLGRDAFHWQAGLSTWSGLAYEDVLPGIDLVVEARDHAIKYTLEAEAGVDVSALRLRYDGATDLRLASSGALEIRTGTGLVREEGLVCWQPVGGDRRPVGACYRDLCRDGEMSWSYAIEVSGADPSLPVVIDPIILWGTYLGGSDGAGYGLDGVARVAIDANGDACIAGWTGSDDFPLGLAPGFDVTNADGSDLFVSKIDESGTLLWSTYIGGAHEDADPTVAVDANGDIVLAGWTDSHDYPTTPGVVQEESPEWKTYGEEGRNAFVTKLGPAGDHLLWSTYLGSTHSELCLAMALNAWGQIYVTGTTSDAWVRLPGLDRGFNGVQTGLDEPFISKISADGTEVQWSAYLGGPINDDGGIFWSDMTEFRALAVSASDDVILGGTTCNTAYPVTPGAMDRTHGGGDVTPGTGTKPMDGILVKVKGDGTTLTWATYLGGKAEESIGAVAFDEADNVIVTGRSESPDFPITAAAWLKDPLGHSGFLCKVNADGSAMIWSTWIGSGGGVALGQDAEGNIIVGSSARYVANPPVPDTSDGFQPAPGSTTAVDIDGDGDLDTTADVFITKFGPGGDEVIWASYLGGSDHEVLGGLAVRDGGIYLTGDTTSDDLPVPGGFDTTLDGSFIPWDAFVAHVVEQGMSVGPKSLTFSVAHAGDETPERSVKIYSATEALAWSASTETPWISCTPAGTVQAGSHGQMKVNVDTEGLALGVHLGTITVVGAGLSKTVNVTLYVGPPGDPAGLTPPPQGEGKSKRCGASASGGAVLPLAALVITFGILGRMDRSKLA